MRRSFVFILPLVLMRPNAAEAVRTDRWSAGFAFNVTSGDYGTENKTTTTYLPFTFQRLFSRGNLDLVIPFMTVTTDGSVTIVGGRPQRLDRPVRGARRDRHSEGGLGDILLRGRLDAYEGDRLLPATSLIARIKMPTADEDKGLGTGEFDETIGIEFWKDLIDRWAALADFSYTFTGNPPGTPLNDIWTFSLGAGYRFKPTLLGTLVYEESRSLRDGEPNPRDLLFGLSYTGKPPFRFFGNFQIGLSDGSPDVGFGAGGAIRFR